MLTLSATLEAAQRAGSRRPYVECYVDNRPVEVPRLDWAVVYSGGGTDRSSAAVVTSTGVIVRVRAESDGAGGFDLWYQRITDASVGSQWSSGWGILVAGIKGDGQCVALQASDSAAVLRVFYISSSGAVLYCKRSTNHGVTWGAPETVEDVTPATVNGVASDGRSGESRVVYGVDPGGVDPDDQLHVANWNGAAWVAGVDGAVSYTGIHSLGVCRGDDARLTILIASGSPLQIGLRRYDTVGSAFEGDYELVTPGGSSGYAFSYPYARASNTTEPRLFYLYFEDYSGVGSYQVTRLCTTPVGEWLANEVPVDIQSTRGASLIKTGGYWYCVSSRRALKALAYAGGVDRVEVSGDVVGVELEERGPMRPGKVEITLDNSDGAYEDAGVSGTYKWVREGSQVALKLGYVSTAGDEAVWASPWWIERVWFEDLKGEGYVHVDCIDAWGWLERLRVRRQVVFTSQTLNYILLRVLWHVCGVADGTLHANLDVTVPKFVWVPGERLGAIARKILGMAGLWLRFRTASGSGNGAGWDSVGVELVELGTGGSVYSYGASGHRVTRGRYGAQGQRANDFAVVGSANEGFQIDWDGVMGNGRDLWERVVDKHLDTQAKVDDLADYLNYVAEVGIRDGFIDVWANVGQQVGDVVDITDSRANLSAAERRVSGIGLRYDVRRGLYDQRIEIVGV